MENHAPGALTAYLRSPDVVLPDGEPTPPLPMAVAIAAGLSGMALFSSTVGIGILSHGQRSLDWPALMVIPPLVAVLSVPPLLLISALLGRAPGTIKVIGVAASGPTITGACLGAASPLVLLYALTGQIDASFVLLVMGLTLTATAAGAWGALKNSRRAGAASPGRLIVLGHYLFTLWTALVLTLHLA